jgi:nitrate reductase beta subunit
MNHLQDEEQMSGRAYLTAVDEMRIPISYLASLLAAGDTQVVRQALVRLVAMRMHMRNRTVGDVDDEALLQEAGMTGTEVEDMARLLGVAKYEERFVIPTAIRDSPNLEFEQGACGLEGIAPPEGLRPRRLKPRSTEKREHA